MSIANVTKLSAVLLLAGLGACGLEEEGKIEMNPEDLKGVTLGSTEQKTFSGNLGTATGSPIAMGNTTGLTNDFTAACISASTGNTAPEATFIWQAPSAGTYSITTAGSSFDTTLDIYDLNGFSIACNDDTLFTLQSAVSVTLQAGQLILINLDGWRAAQGAYRLNVNRQ
jgi:uncharacterized protein (AIM24 family)